MFVAFQSNKYGDKYIVRHKSKKSRKCRFYFNIRPIELIYKK